MQTAPLPPNETQRLEELHQLSLLDTPAERTYDDVTALARELCATPIALVSLVDAERQWFKSRQGLDACETSRDVAFCAHAILGDALFEVPDSHADPRFADNPLVTGPPHVRFYAGVPLITASGNAVGTLCVIDHVPRHLDDAQRHALVALGRQVVTLFELRQKATLLERSRAELSEFLENVHDLVQSVDPDGRILSVNRAWSARLGYTAEEALGMHFLDVVAPELRDHCRALMTRVRAGEDTGEVDAILLAKGGERVYVQGSTTRHLRDGRVIATRTLFRDVTQRLKAEEALREQAAVLSSFYESAPMMMGVVRLEGDDLRHLSDNRATELFFGAAREALRGRLATELGVPPEQLRRWVEAYRECARRAEPVRFEYAHGERWLSVTVAPIDADQGTFCYVAKDATARRTAMDQQTRLVAILENTPDFVGMATPDGFARFLNRAGRQMIGVAPDAEVTAMNIADIHPPWALEIIRRVGIPTALEKGRWVGETALLGPTGEIPVSQVILSHPAYDGTPAYLSTIARDISERKEVERMKGEFVSTVSHELRTPLTSIRGALRLLESGLGGPIADAGRELLGIASGNVERLTRLVNDILDLEKIESGKLQLDIGVVDAAEVCRATERTLAPLAGAGGISIEVDVPEGVAVRADADRLVQVLTNLLSNAIKFSPGGARVQVRSRRAGPRVRFEVEDRGPGIPDVQIPLLFGRFHQVDASDSRKRGGSGLGLAIAKAIVEQHGGSIGLTSRVGHGSKFWFELPAAADPDPELSSDSRPVLVVEDDEDASRLLQALLQREGYVVARARALEDARRLLARHRPAAVLLDVQLPDGSGLDLLPELEANEVPVVVVSGRDPEGADFGTPFVLDWLRKPFDEERLLRALSRVREAEGEPFALVVEADPMVRQGLLRVLERAGMAAEAVGDGAEAIRVALQRHPRVLITDVALPGADAFEIVAALRKAGATLPVVVHTGRDLSEAERARLTLGLTHFLRKGRVDQDEFARIVGEALRRLG